MDSASEFCRLLDSQPLPERADVILVLRNWDPVMTKERFDLACDLFDKQLAPIMLMSYDSNTKQEAVRFHRIVKHMGWNSVVLVTHRSHSYRAMLTFLSEFDNELVYMVSVPSATEPDEFEKIIQYQKQGDTVSYEEGLKWIRTHSPSVSLT